MSDTVMTLERLVEIRRLAEDSWPGPLRKATMDLVDDVRTLQARERALKELLDDLALWCEVQRVKIVADGYDYKSGEEFGIRRVELQINKCVSALASKG